MRSSCSKNCCISIHAPTRGATNGENRYKRIKQFQSTLPRGERQSHHFLLSSSFSYFNPRSHEGSDSDLVMNIYNRNHFNPRSHEGSDVNQAAKKLYDYISIHAPTRGATGLCKYIVKDPQDFNPRSHEGSDTARKQPERTAGNFNPRSHEGSDGQHFMQLRGREISIHAPTRGATLEAMASMAKVPKISIHAPTRGATIHTRSARLLHRISIHAPTRGATRWQQPSRTFRRFQSTLPRGERRLNRKR